MKTNDSAIDFWEAPPWTICIESRSSDASPLILHPERPFVLIGAAEHCDIQLSEPQLPPVAYLVCCFRETVEVWPTAAIAFPRWGVLRAGQSFVVGRSRVSIHHPSMNNECEQVQCESGEKDDSAKNVDMPIGMYWNGKKKSLRLKRAVTLMGSDHPSMLRIQGQCLEPSDHALVSIDDSLWMIDVTDVPRTRSVSDSSSPRSRSTATSGFGCLQRAGEAACIGGLTIAMESPLCVADLGNLAVRYSALRHSPIIHAFSLELKEDSAVERPSSRWGGQPSLEVVADSNGPIAFHEDARSRAAHQEQLRREAESEQLAAQVTERLVSMSNERQSKARGRLSSLLTRMRLPEADAA